jgi:L-asparaginase II
VIDFEAGDLVPIANLVRNDLVESQHFGMACLVDPSGNLVAEYGNSKKLIYPRSAVKPLQAVAARRAGLHLTGAELAVSAGSHHGTKAHTDLVLSILKSVGLDETALQCPVAWPTNSAARSQAVTETKACFNCSGKHAGFLAACVAAGWNTETYLDPSHPLQKLIIEVFEEYSGEPVSHSTVDGCGAPLHAVSLRGLAKALGKFASQDSEVAQAMIQNPWAVADAKSPDTLIMQQGLAANYSLVSKLGAEGVFIVANTDGFAAAVKVADGALRPAPLVAIKLFMDHGLMTKEVHDQLVSQIAPEVLGGDNPVGYFAASI